MRQLSRRSRLVLVIVLLLLACGYVAVALDVALFYGR